MQSLKDKILDVWFTLTHPSFLLMKHKYDPNTDGIINQIINHKLQLHFDSHRTILSDEYFIWLGNYPYVYGTIMNNSMEDIGGRPSRRNIYRFHEYMESLKPSSNIDMLAISVAIINAKYGNSDLTKEELIHALEEIYPEKLI